MDRTLYLLEDMLLRSVEEEIRERYEEVASMYSHNMEVMNIAKSILGLCQYIYDVYRDIPNPERKLDESLYSTLYSILKDFSITLYDLTIAEGEQLYYVISSAYQKINSANNLLERFY
ncbi:hypothetical protein [Thermocrinis minervae]|uniref:Uncharacterized protein n=1 Tax=Thermocrinis minervae TaxID=381751 RepID=A0A1M6S874_9AQUI|nr:hypothetical protein [Thermocrinis minervae]SHK40896.1 hypothetical protein SAMN05444391_0919 [Thermocrinis minervae]